MADLKPRNLLRVQQKKPQPKSRGFQTTSTSKLASFLLAFSAAAIHRRFIAFLAAAFAVRARAAFLACLSAGLHVFPAAARLAVFLALGLVL